MSDRSWESKKEKLRHYNRRSPESTALYRIAYQERQNLEYHWEQQFQQTYGALRFEVLESIDKYLNCGILAHGCARIVCDNCKHSDVVAFSCKKRGICPSCAAELFTHKVLKALLHKELITQDNIDYLMAQKHTGFSAWMGGANRSNR